MTAPDDLQRICAPVMEQIRELRPMLDALEVRLRAELAAMDAPPPPRRRWWQRWTR